MRPYKYFRRDSAAAQTVFAQMNDVKREARTRQQNDNNNNNNNNNNIVMCTEHITTTTYIVLRSRVLLFRPDVTMQY